MRTVEERFWSKVDKTGDCWLWTASTGHGYGKFGYGGRGAGWRGAHRVSWELHFGSIPDGLFVCHHCDNRKCVRPDHLFLGTHEANMRDMVRKNRHPRTNAKKTHCKRNHPLIEGNIYLDRDGHRACRACQKLRQKVRLTATDNEADAWAAIGGSAA